MSGTPPVSLINPISRVLYSMDGPHESLLAGVPAGWSWGSHPSVDAVTPPAGMSSMTAWGQVYASAGAAEPPQGTVRVELMNMAAYVWSNAHHQWVLAQDTADVDGGHFVQDFSGNAAIAADWRVEPDGGISAAMVPGYNLHFWPTGSRPNLPIPASDVGGAYVTVQARLIGSAVASAHYVADVGGDWWRTPSSPYDQGENNPGIGEGRFMYLSGSWAAYDFWTGGAYATHPVGWTDEQMASSVGQTVRGGGQPSLAALAPTPSGGGVWGVNTGGGVQTAGDAANLGAPPPLVAPVVGVSPTPSGHGYWLAASDGGIFTFGDARFYGSTGALRLARPVVGMAATPDGRGYWLVASDGGIFTFGDAGFYGSAGGTALGGPVAAIAPTPSGKGYWLLVGDGKVLNYGDGPPLTLK